jgi:hypothetical protein
MGSGELRHYLRQAWVWYSVPFVVIMYLGCAATGWTIARLHRRHWAAIVILCAAFGFDIGLDMTTM